MLVLNFMYMKKSLFRFSSRRILFSTVIASALIAGGSQAVFADAGEVQVVLQTGTIKGKIVDSNGEPVIGANVMVKGTTNGCMKLLIERCQRNFGYLIYRLQNGRSSSERP
mgnify:FL=1